MFFIRAGAVFGMLSIAFGAFAGHALKTRVDEYLLEIFKTGVQYQITHSLALLFLGLYCKQMGTSKRLLLAGWCFIIGIFLFSGSLYSITLTGIRNYGMITPFGGIAFLVGWFLLFWATFQTNKLANK